MKFISIIILTFAFVSSSFCLSTELTMDNAKHEFDMGNYSETLRILSEISSKTNVDSIKARCYNNIGFTYLKIYNFQLAEKFFKQGLNLKPEGKIKILLLENMGNLLYNKYDYIDAKYYYDLALQESYKQKDYYSMIQAHINYANLYTIHCEYKEAKINLQTAIDIYEKNNLKNQGFYYDLLFDMKTIDYLTGELKDTSIFFDNDFISKLDNKYDLYTLLFTITRKERYIDSILSKCENTFELITNHNLIFTLTGTPRLPKDSIDRYLVFCKENNLVEQSIEVLKILNYYVKAEKNFKLSQKISDSIIEKYEYLKLHTDSLNFANYVNAIDNINKKNESILENQKLNNKIESSKLWNKFIYFTVSIIIISIFIILLVVYSKYKKINKINKLLEEANTTKNKLFQIISHDLNAPVNSTYILSEQLVNLIDKMSNADIKLTSNSIFQSNIRLKLLLDTLLQWSKINLNGFNFKANNELIIKNEIEDVLKLYDFNIKQKNIKVLVNVKDDISVNMENEAFRLIIRNLINNSIKFVHINGEIIIEANEDISFKILTVSDNGVGFPESILTNKTNTSKLGTFQETGYGLGLQIVRDIAEKFNTKIEVLNNNNGGGEVRVLFPN